MFSKRFYKMIALSTKLSSIVAANRLVFNSNSQLFNISNEPNLIRKLRINYSLIMLWLVSGLGIILNLYHGRNISELYVSFVHWAGIAFTLNYMTVLWFANDYYQTINSTLHYFRYYKGNNLSKIQLFF